MISFHVSAVLAVRDGYSGKPISQSTVRCTLDGEPYQPEYRRDGYLVFVNLAPGDHQVVLRGAYYQDERLTLSIGEGPAVQVTVALKPAPNYPFGRKIVSLSGQVLERGKPDADRLVWAAAQTSFYEIKLAQDAVAAGDGQCKVFYRGGGEERRFPGPYLVLDGEKTEVITITWAADGVAKLEEPFQKPHKRGVAMYPAQTYRTDGAGAFLAFYREPVPVNLYIGKGAPKQVALVPGKTEITLGK